MIAFVPGAAWAGQYREAARLFAGLLPRLRRIRLQPQETTHPGSNDQWRTCFKWPEGSPGSTEMEVVDYHSEETYHA